jgi:predicted RNA-binding Zn-ribbon protein involved in translation (DUF1610 family)
VYIRQAPGLEMTVLDDEQERNGLDSLFGRIAMGMGYVTPDLLLECVEEQEHTRVMRPGDKESEAVRLGEIMLAKGIITIEQRDEVLVLQEAMLSKKSGPKQASLGEMLLGQVALREGFIGKRQLERCLGIQARENEEGPHRRLGKIMLDEGYLQPEDLLLLLKMQNRTLMQCVSCGIKYNVEGYEANKLFLCKRCGSSLEVCTDTDQVVADDTVAFELLREIEGEE